MYDIVSEGTIVHSCDKPDYMTLESLNGTPQPTDAAHADCVSVRGMLYQLPGAKHVINDLPAAIVRENIDGGARGFEIGEEGKNTANRLRAATAETEAAICELDMMYADSIAELEMALCDMDIRMNA